ncbi:MAG TPA: cytochrome c [Thermoanaerobaculia bacterium]|nr:cytochrome c [Thermoanaerobaculia bacterium]
MRKTISILLCSAVVVLLGALPALAGGESADASAVYKAKCAMCHGPDGAGQTAMGKKLNVRALGSAEVQKMTDAQLTAIINDGKGKMPAYKGKLNAGEVSGLISLIRKMKK